MICPKCQHARRALILLTRWLEWARMHGHLDHAEGIVKDSRELIENVQGHVLTRSGRNC